jgi:uncharacterized protein YxjI
MWFLLRPSHPDVFVTDEAGRDVYWVRSGVADQVGLWSLRDLGGRELVRVAQHGPRLAPSYGVYRAGSRVATVVQEPSRGAGRWRQGMRALVAGGPGKLRYTVRSPGGQPLDVDGDPAAIEYNLSRDGTPAATVGMRWVGCGLEVGTSVTVADGEDPELILALVAVIESAWGRL